MVDEPIIIDGVDVSKCYLQGETIEGITCGEGKRIRLANQIITKHKLCSDNPNCDYKRCKRAEQNAQDTYDMFKACMQSLEIARKQLSDEQQKIYQIGKVCEEYRVNYLINTGIQLMTGKILDIIGDRTDEY